MIDRMSHTTIFVIDQDEALEFYTERLGFEVRTDVTMGEGFRWLTVSPKRQADLEIVLLEVRAGRIWDEETAARLRELVSKGALGAGVFDTDDCRAAYEELRARGVEFLSPPEERPYGIEATFRDNSGNWFSLTQEPA